MDTYNTYSDSRLSTEFQAIAFKVCHRRLIQTSGLNAFTGILCCPEAAIKAKPGPATKNLCLHLRSSPNRYAASAASAC